jgi:NAD(P)-dependent dehydrogenase (short-subunit alcohol dehydrogenase family)
MAEKMEGKVMLVTGAGRGIGRAIALAFAYEGTSVVVVDVNPVWGNETVELLEKIGGRAVFQQCDVTKGEEVKLTIEATIKEFGRLDYACNNAGIHNETPEQLHDLDEAIWDRIIDVNLKGVMLCMKHEASHMLKQGGGVIVNIASMAGIVHEPGSYAYTVSKHGVMGLTKAAAFEYAKAGIRVNAICPAVIDTPMFAAAPEEVKQALLPLHPIGRFGKPEEVAAAVMWLCSDLSAFVTGTGVILDGGVSTI